MKRETQHYLELLERRLTTLQLLATELNESCSAYVTLDLRAMHSHTARQESLCTELRMVDTELQALQERLRTAGVQGLPEIGPAEAQFDPAAARQLHLLLGGLKVIQADVRRLSRVHSELLRRSRRSVNVLLNFLAHCSGTYPTPLLRAQGPFVGLEK